MLLCGIGAKPVAHLMQYQMLQWEVAKVKQLMTSNMTLTVLNLHQKTPKGATTKIQVKRYKRDIRVVVLRLDGKSIGRLFKSFDVENQFSF